METLTIISMRYVETLTVAGMTYVCVAKANLSSIHEHGVAEGKLVELRTRVSIPSGMCLYFGNVISNWGK
jgi:hypothetical protein